MWCYDAAALMSSLSEFAKSKSIRWTLPLVGFLWVLVPGIEAFPFFPRPISLTPAVSGGNSQTLTAVFDAGSIGGGGSLDVVNVLVNSVLDGRQACYLAYSLPSNALYIVADNGDATQISGKVMDGTGTVGNSQCTVMLSGSSATSNGNTLTLVLNLSFSAYFAGNKVIYAAARDVAQINSGWLVMGVHGVPPLPSSFPNPIGVSGFSGGTSTQNITFTYQDESSAANLQTVWALVNTAIDGRLACYVAYYRPGNLLYLYPDNGDGTEATNIALTGSNTISNSQCTVSAQGARVQAEGNTLTLLLPITFKRGFGGFKGVWLAAQTLGGAQTSPWQALGAAELPAYSGDWSGSTDSGGVVTFTVTDTLVLPFNVHSPGGCAFLSYAGFRIQYDRFSGSGIYGTFDSATTAHGTGCGSWTASKQ
jgi:hypothetical protein